MNPKILDSLDIKRGSVNGTSAKIIRDTGCTTVFVRGNLFKDHQWTGKRRKFYMINNSFNFAPVALVMIDCPWFSGTVEALCPSLMFAV